MSVAIVHIEAEVSAGDGDDPGLSFIDGEVTEVLDVLDVAPARESWLRRAWRTVVRLATRVRAAAARSDVQVVAYARRYRRRRPCGTRVGLHRAERRWFGRRRSTSERNAANAVAHRAAAKEGDLPRVPAEFVSWVDNFIETLRYEQEVLHPPQHQEGRFICS